MGLGMIKIINWLNIAMYNALAWVNHVLKIPFLFEGIEKRLQTAVEQRGSNMLELRLTGEVRGDSLWTGLLSKQNDDVQAAAFSPDAKIVEVETVVASVKVRVYVHFIGLANYSGNAQIEAGVKQHVHTMVVDYIDEMIEQAQSLS